MIFFKRKYLSIGQKVRYFDQSPQAGEYNGATGVLRGFFKSNGFSAYKTMCVVQMDNDKLNLATNTDGIRYVHAYFENIRPI